jgi:succinoglycan biosynthesis protein ExoM
VSTPSQGAPIDGLSPAPERRVAIGVLTYMRPVGLRRLLEHLVVLDVPVNVAVRIVVIDNDPLRSAEPLVAEFADRSIEVHYVCETTRGITPGRNRTVAEARAWRADHVCCIDDDEWPAVDWLTELLATRDATGADVVTGPVLPVFDAPPSGWVTAGGFFDRPRYQHNSEIGYATTSSVLMDVDLFDGWDEPFDHDFGLSGGSDTHLFAQLKDRGCTIVWSDAALVYEAIPTSRVNARWILRREYRRGQTLSRSLRRRAPTRGQLVRRVGSALVQLARGSFDILIGAVRGYAGMIRGAKRLAIGAGLLTGLFGRGYQEYRSIHGS